MDIFLIILSAIFLIIGILGCFLPVLPGPPLAWGGLLLADFTKYASFSNRFLIITAVITIILTILDFIIPALAVKKKGGSKAGQNGALIGAIVGLFFGPFGIILGPFVGAFVGELLTTRNNAEKSLEIALSSFIGFLLSTGLKLIWCLMMLFWLIKALIQ
ncbi:MAG: DUF456 domain-containing protein [Chitinophagaceae bacterium]|nr:DUF456 domain-containing protein [Chitinophagaceae bacterium]